MTASRDEHGIIGLVLLGVVTLGLIALVGYQVYSVRSGRSKPLLDHVHFLPHGGHSVTITKP